MMIEPTTAIAEIALVSDISGVCSSRETFRITSKPMNVASMKTKVIDQKSIGCMGGSRALGGRSIGARPSGRYAAAVRSAPIGLVDIVREFLLAHRLLRRLFERHRSGELRFEDVQALAGDTEASVLFRLKERCHALFRAGGFDDGLPRVALFDLAVGSLFHEAMKLRENFYQLEVYAPKVEAARRDAESGTEGLFEEFARILAASRDRLAEAFAESEALLEQTRRQFRVLLRAHRMNGLVVALPARERRARRGGAGRVARRVLDRGTRRSGCGVFARGALVSREWLLR